MTPAANPRPRWMTLAVVGTGAVVALIVALATVRGVLAPASSAGTLHVAGQDLAALVRASDVVVVGTVLNAGGTRVVSRDPRDLTREDPNCVSITQDYAFSEPIFEELRPRRTTLHTVLIDATPFNVAALDPDGFPVPGGEARFIVFGAASQKRVGGPLDVLLLRASWHKTAYAWRAFLAEIEGDADRIVCDGEQALMQSAKARWPSAKVAMSVWHVRKRAEDILVKHDLHSRAEPLYPALRASMQSVAGWRRFVRLARKERLPELEKWIIETEAVLGPQLARHERFTSTGAIESVLRDVKKHLTLQRGSYKRVERLSLLLNLHTLKRNHRDLEPDYERIIAGAE